LLIELPMYASLISDSSGDKKQKKVKLQPEPKPWELAALLWTLSEIPYHLSQVCQTATCEQKHRAATWEVNQKHQQQKGSENSNNSQIQWGQNSQVKLKFFLNPIHNLFKEEIQFVESQPMHSNFFAVAFFGGRWI
jgi:hypothetical protein